MILGFDKDNIKNQVESLVKELLKTKEHLNKHDLFKLKLYHSGKSIEKYIKKYIEIYGDTGFYIINKRLCIEPNVFVKLSIFIAENYNKNSNQVLSQKINKQKFYLLSDLKNNNCERRLYSNREDLMYINGKRKAKEEFKQYGPEGEYEKRIFKPKASPSFKKGYYDMIDNLIKNYKMEMMK